MKNIFFSIAENGLEVKIYHTDEYVQSHIEKKSILKMDHFISYYFYGYCYF